MKVTTKTAPVKGIGKPDYSREVSAGRERAGISLKYNQRLKLFVACFTDMVTHPQTPDIPWVKPPLAAGAQSHLYDIETGQLTPFSFAAGYAMTMVQKDWTFNQDIELWLYFDSLLTACLGISPSGANIYVNPIYAYTSLTLDPTSASAHTFDFILVNQSATTAMEGGITVAAILEAVGTPVFPETKDCVCPLCTHRQTVKVGTTTIKCDKCGETYIVFDLSKIREF